MTSGYFGYIEGDGYGRIRVTKVHLVTKGKPVCGTHVKGVFHFVGPYTEYVDCTRCIRDYLKVGPPRTIGWDKQSSS